MTMSCACLSTVAHLQLWNGKNMILLDVTNHYICFSSFSNQLCIIYAYIHFLKNFYYMLVTCVIHRLDQILIVKYVYLCD